MLSSFLHHLVYYYPFLSLRKYDFQNYIYTETKYSMIWFVIRLSFNTWIFFSSHSCFSTLLWPPLIQKYYSCSEARYSISLLILVINGWIELSLHKNLTKDYSTSVNIRLQKLGGFLRLIICYVAEDAFQTRYLIPNPMLSPLFYAATD